MTFPIARTVAAPIALTIAGSDSGGGAGIQADMKTFSALKVYAASVITALTAQNTQRVSAIHDVPPAFIRAQMDAVFSDLNVKAVKIGMLSQKATIRAVADGLRAHQAHPIVLDPVMIATSGDSLLAEDALEALKNELVPQALLITPNLPEAAALLKEPIATDESTMRMQAQKLHALGCNAVLIKGGHGTDENSIDVLFDGVDFTSFSAPRIRTLNTHGTGCTLSSAIAAGLAKGLSLIDGVSEAKTYITQAIHAADMLKIGHGHGPVHHFHAFWDGSRQGAPS
jgi:hydroxymethylpyrimidine/phosphomethylpyrimidine kinase